MMVEPMRMKVAKTTLVGALDVVLSFLIFKHGLEMVLQVVQLHIA